MLYVPAVSFPELYQNVIKNNGNFIELKHLNSDTFIDYLIE